MIFKEKNIMLTKKYYTIVSGWKVGIFSNWIEVGPYVQDNGALQQGFATFLEALDKYSHIYDDHQLQVFQGSEIRQKIIQQPRVINVSDEGRKTQSPSVTVSSNSISVPIKFSMTGTSYPVK
ncbi:hypothetical protein DXG01_016690, partial [Tephrocybe rancida]